MTRPAGDSRRSRGQRETITTTSALVPRESTPATLSEGASATPHLSRVAGEYWERRPVAALRETVRGVWRNTLSGGGRPLLVVPDGCIDLLSVDGALIIAGADTEPIIERVAPDATILGIRFHPGVAPRWLRVRADELGNRRVPLTRAEELAERLAETKTTSAALALLAIDLGMSERTVRRRCHELFGYGPKTFMRILRLQRFLSRLQREPRLALSTLATACGYADQAHLSREVKGLTGLTPAAVAAQFARAD